MVLAKLKTRSLLFTRRADCTKYSYDVFNRRIKEVEDADGAGAGASVETRFSYDRDRIWADLDNTNALKVRYVRGDANGELFGRVKSNGDAAWYYADVWGSSRQLVDNAGALKDTVKYDAFGNILSETDATFGDRWKVSQSELNQITHLLSFNNNILTDTTTGTIQSDDTSIAVKCMFQGPAIPIPVPGRDLQLPPIQIPNDPTTWPIVEAIIRAAGTRGGIVILGGGVLGGIIAVFDPPIFVEHPSIGRRRRWEKMIKDAKPEIEAFMASEIWVIDIQEKKGIKVRNPIDPIAAIDHIRAGGNVIAKTKEEARRIARAAGDGGEPIWEDAHGEGEKPHYHPTKNGQRDKGSGHILY